MRLSILIALLPAVLAAPSVKRDSPAPLVIPRDVESLIPDKYIVKFKEGSDVSTLRDSLKILSEDPRHVFENAFRGFSAKMDQKALKSIRNHPQVDYIEQDAIVTINKYVQQANAPWGLGRISHRKKGSTTYTYDNTAGSGVCAYVIDTGIDASHPDFGGRAHQIRSFVDNESTDGNGHGTHVAGIIGSNTYGVAKGVSIYGVKVLSDKGTGPYSGIIAGVDFVASDSRKRKCPKGVVANMSLGGSYSAAVNSAAAALVKKGVFLAVSAGNSNADTSGFSPASEPSACTVGATTSDDARASYSNYGKGIDIFAPGSNILSTWKGGSTNTLSGTSMASPHVAGLAAYYAGRTGSNPYSLCTRMKRMSDYNVLQNLGAGSVNQLAFNGNPSG